MVNRKRRQLAVTLNLENSKSTPYLIKTNVFIFLFWEQRRQPKNPTPIIPKVSFPSVLYFFQFSSNSRICTTRFLLFFVSVYHKLFFIVVLASVPYPSCGVFTTVCSLSTNNLTLFSSKFFTTKLFWGIIWIYKEWEK